MKTNIHYIPFIALILSIMVSTASAQWQRTNGPYYDYIQSVTGDGANILVGSYNGVYRSTDDGSTWALSNDGLTNLSVIILAQKDSLVLVATLGGTFRSTNNGANWMDANNGLPNSRVSCFAVGQTMGFAGTEDSGVFRSSDKGVTWTNVNFGISNLSIKSIAYDGTNLYVGSTESNVFWSTNHGSSWTDVGYPHIFLPSNGNVSSIIINSGSVIVGMDNITAGYYYSHDNGTR